MGARYCLYSLFGTTFIQNQFYLYYSRDWLWRRNIIIIIINMCLLYTCLVRVNVLTPSSRVWNILNIT